MEPSTSLALSVYNGKGIYAVLLGSGVSSAAGVLTGWGIVLDLIRRVAKIAGELDKCGPDPETESWYREKYGSDPDYSALLELIAGTPAERQALLRGYFEPTDAEREEGMKLPTDAHRALADLVVGGYVRVIVTTNFDRLTEMALEAAGVTPAVISTPDAIRGMEPLAHARSTVVKLHGDYLDARLLNTPSELAQYDPATDRLLDQILDEYGLVVSGWSAEWDTALRAAIERAPNRRYSTFWVYPRTLKDAARRLIAHRRATAVSGMTSDRFFRKLAEDVTSLAELAGPQPITAKMAAQAAKRYLPKDEERIRLHDLVTGEVNRVGRLVADAVAFPVHDAFSGELLDLRMRRLEAESAPLRVMFAVGGYWADASKMELWVRSLERLSNVPPTTGTYTVPYESLRRYPALLAAYAAGVGAVAAGQIEKLVPLLLGPMVRDQYRADPVCFASAVNAQTVLDHRFQRELPGMAKHHTPLSERLWTGPALRDALIDFLSDDTSFMWAFDRFEYLAGLLTRSQDAWAPVGCFAWRGGRWGSDRDRPVVIEINSELSSLGADWPLLKAGAFGGSLERLNMAKEDYESTFVEWIRF